MDSIVLGAGMMLKTEAPEPRISSSSAVGEPGGERLSEWPPGGTSALAADVLMQAAAAEPAGDAMHHQHHMGDPSGLMSAIKTEHGGESMYGIVSGGLTSHGSPRLGAAPAFPDTVSGAHPGIPQFGMVPIDPPKQAPHDASAGAGASAAPQLSGASSLGAPSPLPGPSGEDGGSSSGSMPPPHAGRAAGGAAAAAAVAAAHQAAHQQQHHVRDDEEGPNGVPGVPQVFRSEYRGVSYDKKKRKWRVQIKVAALGKSGVSVGYFDTESAAARAYDRAAIGLLGRQNCRTILNFPIEEYDNDNVPELVGKTREEVKATLKSERAKLPRRRLTNRRRTSKYLGVGSSNRKNQWQARILYHGKVTHLGYYRTEEEAARVYDKVSISLHGDNAQTNFPIDQYAKEVPALQQRLSGLSREELQRALGVKPMDRSSKYRGVSKKKGRWEAKVVLNRRWAYRELFDSEEDAAHAYDGAIWRLRPRDARGYVNFKDSCPPDVAEMLRRATKDHQAIALHPSGLPVTAKLLIDGGLLYDDEGVSIKTSKHRMARIVSTGDLATIGDINAATTSSGGDPSGAHDHSGTTGGGTPTALGGASGGASKGLAKSASFTALSALDQASAAAAAAPGAGAAAAAPGVLGSMPIGLFNMGGMGAAGVGLAGPGDMGMAHHHGMTRVHSTPSLHAYQQPQPLTARLQALGDAAGSPQLAPIGGGGVYGGGLMMGSVQVPLQQGLGGGLVGGHGGGVKLEGTYWSAELPQAPPGGMNRSRSCGNLALGGSFCGGAPDMVPLQQHQTVATAAMLQQQQQQQHQQHQHQTSSDGSPLLQQYGGGGGGGSMAAPAAPMVSSGGSEGAAGGGSSGGGARPLLVRVGSEQHLIPPQPTQHGIKGLSRIASESHLGNMVPVTPTSLTQGGGKFGGLVPGVGAGELGLGPQVLTQQQVQQQALLLQQQHLQQQQALYQHHQQQLGLLQQQQQQMAQRQGLMMHRSHSVAVMGGLESIDEMQATACFPALLGGGPGTHLPLGSSSGGAASGGLMPVGSAGGSGSANGGLVPIGAGGGAGALPLLPAGMQMGTGVAQAPEGLPGSVPVPLSLGSMHGSYGAGQAASQQLPHYQLPQASCGGTAQQQQHQQQVMVSVAPAGMGGLKRVTASGSWDGGMHNGGGLGGVLGEPERPDSPFAINGSVQIGGEELDMALAFLNDGPGGGVGYGMQGLAGSGMLAPSPGQGDLGSSLLIGDGAVRMDESAG